MTSAHIVDFTEQACQDVREVGGKALGLAEMTANGLPVAPGFVVTARGYREFLDQPGARQQIGRTLDGDATSPGDVQDLERALNHLPLPDDVEAGIRAGYEQLCRATGVEPLSVAVRSSATAEDSAGASFAGEFETWVDVVGADAVLEHVRKCYASVYSARVLDYARAQEVDPNTIEMAVVVQKTVRARAAGVMFTLSPISGDRSKIAIEASWGLGLAVVGGEVNPDRFLIDKIDLTINERTIGDKQVQYRRGDTVTEVEQRRRQQLCLSDDEVVAIAALGKRLERLQQEPQDIEFAVDEELPEGERVILLQCRPETVWSRAERKPAFAPGAGMMSWITGSISGSVGAARMQQEQNPDQAPT